MIIKAKYPKTERWYMNIETQGFGADSGQNNSSIDMAAVTRNNENVKIPVWNAIDQHTGTYTNTRTPDTYSRESTNTWPDKAPEAPAVLFEVWGLINGGGNRDAGNDVSYNDEDGNPVNYYVGNNGQEYIFKSNTSEPIATVTGDPYEMRRLFKGSEADMDTFYAANVGFGLVGNPIWINGESEATVQSEYDAA